MKRVVLDTNVVVSALLFRGETSRLHALWKKKTFSIAASKEIMAEYVRVLAYPKFKLTEGEIKDIIQEELLPFVEPILVTAKLVRACADPDDDKFLACAKDAKANAIVSGDEHLLSLKKFNGCLIVKVEEFLKKVR